MHALASSPPTALVFAYVLAPRTGRRNGGEGGYDRRLERLNHETNLAAATAIVLTLATDGYALDPSKAIAQYVHVVWDSDDGLPQNSVSAIIQTRDGYIWFGTQEGLVRFDGVRFSVYDTTREPAISHNFVTALLEDRDGALWIGFNNGSMARYADGRFTAVNETFGRSITALGQDSDGGLWIGTREDGVAMFRPGPTPVVQAN